MRHPTLLSLFLFSCGSEPAEKSDASLPADTASTVPVDSGIPIVWDTFDPGNLDEEPTNVLWLLHHGEWSMTPVGGPYENVTGLLRILEFIDGDVDQPWCQAVFAITGTALAPADFASCATCDYGFNIDFYLTIDGGTRPRSSAEPLDSGGTLYDEDDLLPVNGLEDCRSPDLPTDGASWRMAWSELEGLMYVDYGATGMWMPFYEGEREFDEVTFGWSTVWGFVVPEEEEE